MWVVLNIYSSKYLTSMIIYPQAQRTIYVVGSGKDVRILISPSSIGLPDHVAPMNRATVRILDIRPCAARLPVMNTIGPQLHKLETDYWKL